MPGRFTLKPTLEKIWRAPDRFRIMDPLPPLHRRGVIAGLLLVIIGVLLPSGDEESAPPSVREARLNLQSTSQPAAPQPLPPQAATPPVNDPGQLAPVEPEPVQEQIDSAAPAASPPPAARQQQNAGSEPPWRSWRVESGKTLAQMFRDHNLPATDAYAMAQVEGAGKPLSSLHSGQVVRIRQNANGVVTGLAIDSGDNQQVLFVRQANGSFIRAR